MTTAAPRAPQGLSGRGRRLWRRVLAQFDLADHELELLLEACRTVDAIERLETELSGAPLTVDGSRGQVAAHPLLAEVRAQRDLLARLLGRLALPSDDETEAAAARLGRRGAAARWNRPGARGA